MNLLIKRSLIFGLPLYIGYDFTTKEQNIKRNLRTIYSGLKILYNFKWRFASENAEQIHEETAKDLYELCRDNDGLYVKFGQQVAASEHMLPPVYFKYFSLLQDQAKKTELIEVK
jgi:aarF domain-containing kinase